MKTYTVGILAGSLVRGLPSDLVAMKVTVRAADRMQAAIKAYPNIMDIAQGITDRTIKYISVYVGRADVPSEYPMRLHPFQYRIQDGAMLDCGKMFAGRGFRV